MDRIQVMVNDEIMEKLERYSNLYGVSKSGLVNFLIHDSIDELELDRLLERCEGASIKEIIKYVFKAEGHR